MPRHTRPVETIFDKESRTPAQNVRPEDIGNRIDDSVIAYQIVEPGQNEMRFAVNGRRQPATVLRFECFQSDAQRGCFFIGQDG